MAAKADPAALSSDTSALARSLELALKGCLQQLRTLRASASSQRAACASAYAAEERALKLSLSAIVARLQAVREAEQARGIAWRQVLLLDVLPRTLWFLSTTAVLSLAQASVAVRSAVSVDLQHDAVRLAAADSAACPAQQTEGRRLLVPHLDAAPHSLHACRQFLAETVALGSVRCLSLPCAATAYLLAEHAASLSALEVLTMQSGLQDFSSLPELSSLRVLRMDARGADSCTVERVGAALLGLAVPLKLLQVTELKPLLVTTLLDAITPGGLVEQLTFCRCVLSDAAVARICSALLLSGIGKGLGAPLRKVRFEECALSERAEQLLLETLEQCEGRCVVAIDGGMAKHGDQNEFSESATCVKKDGCKDAGLQEADVHETSESAGPARRAPADVSQTPSFVKQGSSSGSTAGRGPSGELSSALQGSSEVMPIKDMLALAFLRLQEELASSASSSELPLTALAADAAATPAFATDEAVPESDATASASAAPVQPSPQVEPTTTEVQTSNSLDFGADPLFVEAEGRETAAGRARRSRFGFTLEDET